MKVASPAGRASPRLNPPTRDVFRGLRQLVLGLGERLEDPPKSNRLIPLEGIRGFSALIVFFVHFYAIFGYYAGSGTSIAAASRFAASLGHSGVDLFFALSGFLIYGITLRKFAGYASFLWRRIVRLYPAFLCVFGLYLAASVIFTNSSKIPTGAFAATIYLIENLLLLPGLFPMIRPLITPAWSLSYEMCFYIIIPPLVGALRMRSWMPAARVTFFVFIAIAHLLLCWWKVLGHPRMVMFVAGILVYECMYHLNLGRLLSREGEWVAISMGVGTLGIVGVSWGSASQITSVPIPSVGLLFFAIFWCILYTVDFAGKLQRFFSIQHLRRFGNMSYSYYLIHGFSLHALHQLLIRLPVTQDLSTPGFLVLFALSLIWTIAAGTALFLLVEQPVLLRQKMAPARAAASIPAG